MHKRLINILLTVLAVLLLIGYAFAIPHPALTDEALDSYMNDDASADDEYDFLFD